MPEIVADAAVEILSRDPRECTGNVFIDDEVLAEAGITDLDGYAGKPGANLALDIFVDGWPEPATTASRQRRGSRAPPAQRPSPNPGRGGSCCP